MTDPAGTSEERAAAGLPTLRVLVARPPAAVTGGTIDRSLRDPTVRFEVEHTDSVDGAVGLLLRERFDAVLLDLALADASSADAVAAVRRAAPTTAILALGASDDDDAALEAVRAGAQDCLARTCIAGGCDTAAVLLRRSLRFAVERVRAGARMAFLAEHDALTGLPERAAFRSELQRALARARRSRTRVAVLFLDLDRFKAINDRHGHHAGDGVLVQLARRLRGCLREPDTVARYGGDEFLVLLEGQRSTSDAVGVARKIQRAAARAFAVPGGSARCSASIGIALSPPDGVVGPDVLIGRADAAMYRAKTAGGARLGAYAVAGEQPAGECG